MLVVNTCAFIDSAKQESIDTILEMAEHKKDGACQRLDRHRLPGRALSRRAAGARSPRSTPCSAPAKCRRSSARSAAPRSSARGAARRSFARQAPGTRHPAPEPQPRHLPTYIYDADTPRAARDAAALRVREDRRRLRLQVRVLHHPDAARRTTAAGRPSRSSARRARWRRAASRNCCSSRRTRRSTASTASERGALARLLRELNAVDGLEWIRLLYLYPRPSTTRRSRRWPSARRSASTSTCRCSTRRIRCCKRMKRPGTRQNYDALLDRIRDARARRRPAHDVHRRLPRRDRGRRRRAVRVRRATTRSTTSASSPTRTRKARRPTRSTTTCRRGSRRRGATG